VSTEPVERKLLTIEDIAKQLTAIAHHGLPAGFEQAGELLGLPIVLAHARGTDGIARLVAFNELLEKIVQELPGYADAPARLFALPPALRSWSWTTRQTEAADALNYNPDHFRKHVQNRLIGEVAYELVRRNARFRPVPERRILPDEQPPWTTPPAEDLEALELEARIYEQLYALRADLLAAKRLQQDSKDLLEQFSVSALWHYSLLQQHLVVLHDQYGDALFRTRAAERGQLATALDWRGPLLNEEVVILRQAAMRAGVADQLAAALATSEVGRRVLDKWQTWIASA
jgi:hypothetical protein